MTHLLRRSALAALLLVSSSLSAQQNPWDLPPFAAEPKALVAAASKVQAGDFSLVTLLDEADYVIAADGNARSKERIMYYVVSEAGVEYAGEVRAPWVAWYGRRPEIEARVITKDGTVHTLDKAAIVEVAAEEQNDIYSDARIVRAPLPAVAVGSVIEYIVTRESTNPIAGGGISVHYSFGGFLPAERTRVTLDAPASATPRIVNKSGVEPRVEEKDGRRRMIFESGRIEGEREFDDYVPYDVEQTRFLSFSTGTSWQHIARSYSDIVDKQIAGAELQKLVRNTISKSTDRKEIVTKLLAAIQKEIRYAGVEVGEGSIIPRTPRQVFANKYGDCKDKATLLVAMLREAGLGAHVALLAAGDTFDILPELPGLSRFNHAIVVVDGDPAIWVDPTDVFARAGELPLLDQNRLALIARPETTTLTRTPESPSTANLYRERRTFVLPEDGKARVVEVTEPTAISEASLRRWVAGLDSKTLRENLEEYAKSAYVAKTLAKLEVSEPADLTKQFRMTLEVPESESGMAGNGEGAVAINVVSLAQHVPDTLRDWKEPEPGDDPESAPKKRKYDFLFPQPAVREWVYRIVPPAGYVPRTLLPSETRPIGTMTYSQELRAEPDNSVVATFRFDSGRRRLTPAEFQETRVAFAKFLAGNSVTIGFEQIGQAKLNAGDVKGALDEFRGLVALHPKEAQHHIETARALLASGLADSAREAISRALAIEPKNARAHQILASILLHDSIGRPYRKGFDLPGAIAELRKAKELDPDDYPIRIGLATTLTYGEDGIRFGRNAALAAAADEYKSLAADLGDKGKAMLPELTLIYAHMGDFQDIRTAAATYDDKQQRDLASLIATATIDGTEAALRELGTFDQQRRRNYASGVAQALQSLRRYQQAAAFMEAAAQGTPNQAESRQFIEILKKIKRFEDLPADDSPRSVVATFVRGGIFGELDRVRSILPPEYLAHEDILGVNNFAIKAPDEMPAPVFADLIVAVMEVQQDGDDESGYRLRVRTLGSGSGTDAFVFYVRREDGRWVIRGMSNALELVGDTVLKLADEGKADAARKWLNWAREEVKGGSGDDPLDGSPLAAVWAKSTATATLDQIRVAGAVLATSKVTGDKGEPILVAGREKAENDAAKAAMDRALVKIYGRKKEWAKALAITERLYATYPDSATAFLSYTVALQESGKLAEANALANQRLEKMPDDRDALVALSETAARGGDYAASQRYATKLVEELRPKREDFNHAAWVALFTGERLERAVEHAQHASKEASAGSKAASLNTLAAVYAETGKNAAARDALLQGLDNRKLNGADWYVLGRIAENYGVNDYAIASYKKVEKDGSSAPASVLAQRRLEALTKRK
jgi:predicted Zn-dependent protease